jgi:hypothetical protein
MRSAVPRGTTSGQAGVEHVAVVALVAVALGGAVAAAGGLGTGVANAVHSGVRRAICVAGGDRCAAFHGERPCVVGRDERRQAKALTVAFVRIGARVGVVREQWSDGRTVVTVHDDVDAGATLGIGAELAFAGGLAFDLSASATGTVRGGWGRSWTFERPEDADRMVRRLLDGRDAPDALQGVERGIDALIGNGLPQPDAEGIRLGRERSARAAVRGLGVDLDAQLFDQLEGEALYDRRNGRLTVALALGSDVLAGLTGPIGLELGGRFAGDARVAVILDRDLRPLELRMVGGLRTAAGSRREQAELRVDLTRPQIGAALRGMLTAVRDGAPRRAADEAAALGRWAAAEGAIERRTYRVADRRDARGGTLALGAKLGYETTDAASEWRLERAATRPPGGIWEQRVDCVAKGSS